MELKIAFSIDTEFVFTSDTPSGKDPDSHSPMLRRYHQKLWSKPLPSGAMFDLSPGAYLQHESALGKFDLSSDAVIPSFRTRPKVAAFRVQMPQQAVEQFDAVGYTIGGMMLWPRNQVGGKNSINQTRGCHPRIADRFDLTVECVRRHYVGEISPLSDTLARYSDFFALFGDFKGFVEFFLLQDLVTEDFCQVTFMHQFDDFKTPAVPSTLDEYREYVRRATEFIDARNRRIAAASESELE